MRTPSFCFFLDFARGPTSLLPSFGAASSLASGMTGPLGIIRCLTSRDITTFIWRCLLTRTEGDAAAREGGRERDIFPFFSRVFCSAPASFDARMFCLTLTLAFVSNLTPLSQETMNELLQSAEFLVHVAVLARVKETSSRVVNGGDIV